MASLISTDLVERSKADEDVDTEHHEAAAKRTVTVEDPDEGLTEEEKEESVIAADTRISITAS
jgi:hypothetical protein